MRKKVKESNDAIEAAKNKEAAKRSRENTNRRVEMGEALDQGQGEQTNSPSNQLESYKERFLQTSHPILVKSGLMT